MATNFWNDTAEVQAALNKLTEAHDRSGDGDGSTDLLEVRAEEFVRACWALSAPRVEVTFRQFGERRPTASVPYKKTRRIERDESGTPTRVTEYWEAVVPASELDGGVDLA